ncbi:hypothetical protein JCGZ_03457 [Jatropha curcas]|uniref:Uncharacterized protein n=1 Tax=Jatropha curcas TaxID=180498 RepID=A0A067KUN6_JATCU|nr:uncharacterized protein LOC105632320 [Jatropha curcas]KDP39926.1 hypothetical protein JCGZ_03457 [Jatropha curcas]
MENTSGSEIPNSRHSLSLPTEPPDIRNWFPSYKYETFVLDTYDAFGGSALEESENEGDVFALFEERNREKAGNLSESTRNSGSDNKLEVQSLSRMADSTCALSLLSEPPHIGNWYSSYMYESPVLETTVDDYKESATKESESEKEGFDYEGSKRKREDNFDKSKNSFEDTEVDKPSNEITDSSQSSPILSEVPDIKKWFFSHVYESPETDGFVDTETECKEDDSVNQQSNKEKERNLLKLGQAKITDEVAIDEKVTSIGFLKFNSSLRVNKQENQSLSEGIRVSVNGNLSTQDNLCCDSSQRFAENLKNKARTEEHILSPASNVSIVQTPVDLIRKSSHGSIGKENEGKEVLENGFVTTKKNRQIRNDENYLYKPKKNVSQCARNERITSSGCGNEAAGRKVLTERTNLENTNAIEVTGKWKCPQKTKPNVGPPLKQLRLERWIHRV